MGEDVSEHKIDGHEPHSMAYRVVRGMLTIMFFWLFWKFGGLVLNIVIGRYFGSGVEAKAYFFSIQKVVYLLIFSTGLKVIAPAFIPLFIELRTNEGEKKAWDFTYTILNMLLIAAIGVIVVFIFFAEPITNALVQGFTQEERRLGMRLLKLAMPGVLVLMASWLATCQLNAYKNFGFSPAAEATQKLLWVVALVVTYTFIHRGIYAIGLGFLVGCGGQVVILLWGWRSIDGGYRVGLPMLSGRRTAIETAYAVLFAVGTAAVGFTAHHLAPEKWKVLALMTAVLGGAALYFLVLWKRTTHRASAIARFAALAAPLMMSTLFARYRDLVRNYFQSYTIQGYANFDYGMKIAMVPPVFIAYTLSIAMFPYLCELTARKDAKSFSELINRTLRMLAVGFVPLTLFTIILAEPIVRLIYDPGDRHVVHIFYMALSLQIIIASLVFYATENVVLQSYFSLQSMWIPTLMGILATFFDIAVQAVPIFIFGLDSPLQIFIVVAISFPLSRAFKNSILLLILHRKVRIFDWKPTLMFAGKLAAVSVISSGLLLGTLKLVEHVIPYEPYRQYDVVVDDFEPGPFSWVSLNWKELEITGDQANHFLRMAYPRGPLIEADLTGSLTFLRETEVSRVRMRLASERSITSLRVQLTDRNGNTQPASSAVVVPPSEDFKSYEFRFAPAVKLPGRITLIDNTAHDRAPDAGLQRENVLRLDDLELLDEAGGQVWLRTFDGAGWAFTGGSTTGLISVGGDRPANGLAIPQAVESATRNLRAYDLSGCTDVKFKLYVEQPPEEPLTISLTDEEGTVYSREWKPESEGWNRARMPLQSFEAEAGNATETVADLADLHLEFPARGHTWAVRELVFYRPPSRMKYELMKFLHCAIPSTVGFGTLLLMIWLVRIEELQSVIQWVRKRGWKKQKEQEEQAAGPTEEV